MIGQDVLLSSDICVLAQTKPQSVTRLYAPLVGLSSDILIFLAVEKPVVGILVVA